MTLHETTDRDAAEDEAFREQCRRQMARPVGARMKYGFCRVQRPVLDTPGVRIFDSTTGALNWEQCSVPAADAAMDAGLAATDKATIESDYATSVDALVDSGCWVNIADIQEVIVANSAYTGFVHQLPTLFTIRFGDLKVSGG